MKQQTPRISDLRWAFYTLAGLFVTARCFVYDDRIVPDISESEGVTYEMKSRHFFSIVFPAHTRGRGRVDF